LATLVRLFIEYPTSFFGRSRFDQYQDVALMDDKHNHWHPNSKWQLWGRRAAALEL
jgi:hypothetical protein